MHEILFPEGISFNKEKRIYRTRRLNSVFSQISAKWKGFKDKSRLNIESGSCLVDGSGVVSNFSISKKDFFEQDTLTILNSFNH